VKKAKKKHSSLYGKIKKHDFSFLYGVKLCKKPKEVKGKC